MKSFSSLFLTTILLLHVNAMATSYSPISLGKLTTEADLIVIADLESLELTRVKDLGLSGSPGKAVFSVVSDTVASTMRPAAYQCKNSGIACGCIKGVCQAKVTVTWDSVVWVDKPTKIGTYLLFLKKKTDGTYESFGSVFGMYPIIYSAGPDSTPMIEKNYLLKKVQNEFSFRAGQFLEDVDTITQYSDGMTGNYTKNSGLPIKGLLNEMYFNWEFSLNL